MTRDPVEVEADADYREFMDTATPTTAEVADREPVPLGKAIDEFLGNFAQAVETEADRFERRPRHQNLWPY